MRKVLTIFFTTAALFLCLTGMHGNAAAQKPSKKAENLAKEADKFYNSGNFKAAVQKYGEAVNVSPVFPRARFFKGNAHFKNSEFREAVIELDMALSQGYSALEVLTVRMEAHFGEDNLTAALADVNKAIALSPGVSFYRVFLGRLKIINGDFTDALVSLKKAVELGERSADVHYYLAIAYGGSDDLAGQETSAAEALKKGTANSGEAWYLVADSQHRRKKYQESVQSYQNAVNAFKNDINTGRTTDTTKDDLYQTYVDFADVYRNLNRFKEAINTAQEALSLRPNDGSVHTSLAWYFSLSGEVASAIVAGKKAVELSPESYLAHTNLCRAYNEQGEYFYQRDEVAKANNWFNQALASCNTALKLQPQDGETNYYLGRAHYFLENAALSDSFYKKSVPRLVQYTKDNPNYSDGFYLLGNAYFATKQNKNAIAAYKECLRLSPRFARVRYNLGYVLVQQKEWDNARAEHAVLKEIDKDLAAKLLDLITSKAPKQ